MIVKNRPRGTATRAKNKELRRSRILSCAGSLITKHGVDGFTLSQLAHEAQVTVPTIHNLIGKKSDLYRLLVEDMIQRTDELIHNQTNDDPIESVELFIDGLIDLYSVDENLYKAAFMAGEQVKLFEHEMPSGIYRKALSLAENVCQNAALHGYLNGHITIKQLAIQLFSCQRIARHDWMHGYINLQEYRSQVLTGMYITLAADATNDFRTRLIEKLSDISNTH